MEPRYVRYVDANINWKYVDWQAWMLSDIFGDSSINEKLKGAFSRMEVDWLNLYQEILRIELDTEANKMFNTIYMNTRTTMVYHVKPTSGILKDIRKQIEYNIDYNFENKTIEFIQRVPGLTADTKTNGGKLFGEILQYHEIFEKADVIRMSMALQIVLYTILMKSRVWHKLVKSPPAKKNNRLQKLTDWYKQFRHDYSYYILSDSCPYQMDIKDLRQLRDTVYYTHENNGYVFEMAEKNDLKGLKEVLDRGFDVNSRNGKRRFKSLLHLAVINQNEELFDLLMPYKPDPNVPDRFKMTPLFYAIEKSDEKMIQRLLQMGADVEYRDEHNATPVYWSIYCSTLPILKLLSSHGATMAVTCMMNRNCLIKAAFMDKYDIVQYLLQFDEVKKTINDADQRGRTPLHAACWGAKGGREGKKLAGVEVPDSEKSLEYLLDAGADVGNL